MVQSFHKPGKHFCSFISSPKIRIIAPLYIIETEDHRVTAKKKVTYRRIMPLCPIMLLICHLVISVSSKPWLPKVKVVGAGFAPIAHSFASNVPVAGYSH